MPKPKVTELGDRGPKNDGYDQVAMVHPTAPDEEPMMVNKIDVPFFERGGWQLA